MTTSRIMREGPVAVLDAALEAAMDIVLPDFEGRAMEEAGNGTPEERATFRAVWMELNVGEKRAYLSQFLGLRLLERLAEMSPVTYEVSLGRLTQYSLELLQEYQEALDAPKGKVM